MYGDGKIEKEAGDMMVSTIRKGGGVSEKDVRDRTLKVKLVAKSKLDKKKKNYEYSLQVAQNL